MKQIIIYTGIILISVNVLAGIIFNCYERFNIYTTSLCLFVNTALLWLIAWSRMKDAFKISLTILFPVFAIIEFVLMVLSPQTFKDNTYLMVTAILIAIQIIILIIVSNKKINHD